MPPAPEPFASYYRTYRAKHLDARNRLLHLLAKVLALGAILAAVVTQRYVLLLAAPILAVAPCWIGHLLFERNRPASWDEPNASLLGALSRPWRRRAPGGAAGRWYYSLLADCVMCAELLGFETAAVTRERT
jgi:hypothetical protein